MQSDASIRANSNWKQSREIVSKDLGVRSQRMGMSDFHTLPSTFMRSRALTYTSIHFHLLPCTSSATNTGICYTLCVFAQECIGVESVLECPKHSAQSAIPRPVSNPQCPIWHNTSNAASERCNPMRQSERCNPIRQSE